MVPLPAPLAKYGLHTSSLTFVLHARQNGVSKHTNIRLGSLIMLICNDDQVIRRAAILLRTRTK
ncbi:hypothetical protein JOE11_000650 [Robbsia andropogonis]